MIAIGNEQWGEVYPERLEVFTKAIRAEYPDMQIVGSSGPSADGDKFDYLWPEMKRIGVDLVDEHYYMAPDWFFANAARYDDYDRKGPKVFAGEYASHDHPTGKANNFLAALSEAAFMTGLERNADVVTMTSYAPLLAKEGHTQWNPDLIYFNNTEVKPTVGYYAQQMYGQNAGSEYIASSVTLDNAQDAVKKRIGVSVVRDGKTGDMIVKLVNLLPVAVNAQVELPSLEGMNTTAVKTVLAGKPTDQQVRPVSGTIEVSEKFGYELPAYSFTVIRINKNEK